MSTESNVITASATTNSISEAAHTIRGRGWDIVQYDETGDNAPGIYFCRDAKAVRALGSLSDEYIEQGLTWAAEKLSDSSEARPDVPLYGATMLHEESRCGGVRFACDLCAATADVDALRGPCPEWCTRVHGDDLAQGDVLHERVTFDPGLGRVMLSQLAMSDGEVTSYPVVIELDTPSRDFDATEARQFAAAILAAADELDVIAKGAVA